MPLDSIQLKHWEGVLKSVNTEHVPVDCLKKVMFKLKGGRQKTINVARLRKNGLDIEEIEAVVANKMVNMSNEIVDIDFVIDIQEVANIVQPITDKLLENL